MDLSQTTGSSSSTSSSVDPSCEPHIESEMASTSSSGVSGKIWDAEGVEAETEGSRSSALQRWKVMVVIASANYASEL